MDFRAITKNVRISPKKARLAAGLIRGLFVDEAFSQLRFSKLKGARHLYKTLKSAVANAKQKLGQEIDTLRLKEVRVDEGMTMKRIRSKNRGGRTTMLRRTSHFMVIVKPKE
ncbi:MAG: 50S ribosomal protein L22 [Chlamydiae bacterium SM23_39]|nr:MAG: 50S ribosomal protein L22 [Chlamydiae bacterium SM23_39]